MDKAPKYRSAPCIRIIYAACFADVLIGYTKQH